MSTRLLTAGDIALQMGLHPQTVCRWIKRHKIPVIRHSHRYMRIKETDWEAFVLTLETKRQTLSQLKNAKSKKTGSQ